MRAVSNLGPELQTGPPPLLKHYGRIWINCRTIIAGHMP